MSENTAIIADMPVGNSDGGKGRARPVFESVALKYNDGKGNRVKAGYKGNQFAELVTDQGKLKFSITAPAGTAHDVKVWVAKVTFGSKVLLTDTDLSRLGAYNHVKAYHNRLTTWLNSVAPATLPMRPVKVSDETVAA